jgi:hypothetical protein
MARIEVPLLGEVELLSYLPPPARLCQKSPKRNRCHPELVEGYNNLQRFHASTGSA